MFGNLAFPFVDVYAMVCTLNVSHGNHPSTTLCSLLYTLVFWLAFPQIYFFFSFMYQTLISFLQRNWTLIFACFFFYFLYLHFVWNGCPLKQTSTYIYNFSNIVFPQKKLLYFLFFCCDFGSCLKLYIKQLLSWCLNAHHLFYCKVSVDNMGKQK